MSPASAGASLLADIGQYPIVTLDAVNIYRTVANVIYILCLSGLRCSRRKSHKPIMEIFVE